MNLGTMIGAGGLVLIAAVGVPQYQKYQHRKEGEQLYSTAITQYRHAVDAAETEHDLAQAQIVAKFQAEVALAGKQRDTMVEQVKRDYPEVVVK
jgi:Tfp pilus assembly major pilin PilA